MSIQKIQSSRKRSIRATPYPCHIRAQMGDSERVTTNSGIRAARLFCSNTHGVPTIPRITIQFSPIFTILGETKFSFAVNNNHSDEPSFRSLQREGIVDEIGFYGG